MASFLRRLLIAGPLLAAVPVQAQDEAGFLAAVRRDDADRLISLMLRGLSANAVLADGTPVLVAAARGEAWAVLRELLRTPGVKADAADPTGETALMLACLHGRLDAARALVKAGAQINRPGWTPLHYAASAGQDATVAWLLEESAYIDAESPNGTTPLMMAARQKHTSVVERLLAEGADAGLRNQAGLSAADYLERAGEVDAARALRAGRLDRGLRSRDTPPRVARPAPELRPAPSPPPGTVGGGEGLPDFPAALRTPARPPSAPPAPVPATDPASRRLPGTRPSAER